MALQTFTDCWQKNLHKPVPNFNVMTFYRIIPDSISNLKRMLQILEFKC